MSGKWAKYVNTYNPKWEQEDALKDWIAPAPLNSTFDGKAKAYCKFCNVKLRAHHGDLIDHSKRAKHKSRALRHNRLNSEQLSTSSDKHDTLYTEEEILDEVVVNENDFDEIAIEFLKDVEQEKNKKLRLKQLEIINNKPQIDKIESSSVLAPQSPNCTFDATSQNPDTTCKWQKFEEEKILFVQEKRKQIRMEHNLMKAEYGLKMKIMQEESLLRKRKLELEILNLERSLLQSND